MTEPPSPSDPPPRLDVDAAQRILFQLVCVAGVPAVAAALVIKGIGAALATGVIVVSLWLPLAGVIPTQREVEEMRAKPGPLERAIVAILGLAAVVICLGLLFSSKNAGWYYVR